MNTKPETCKFQSPKKCFCGYNIFPILMLFSGSFFSAQSVSGQSIGNWTFNGVLTGTPGTFNTVSTADFSTGVPTHSFNGSTEYFGENGWPTGAINTSMYMQFSLTPLTGYQLDISTLVLRMRRSNTGSPPGSGPVGWSLRSSLDGFSTDITSGSMTLNYADYTVTPGSAFLNIYTTVTFRLYGYNTTVSSGGFSRFVIDNIKVNGIGYLLPVRLGTLNASAAGEKVHLSYTVYNTEKNDRYLIERSIDGASFNTFYTTDETGNAAEKNYTYTDDISLLNGVEKVFYRMHLLNNTGADTYSGIITVKVKTNQAPVKPFIRNNKLYMNGIFPGGGLYHAAVYSTNGQEITHISFIAVNGYNTFAFNLSRQIPGSCIIHLYNGKGYSSSNYSLNP